MSAEETVLGMWHALSDRDWEKLKTFIADDCIYVDMPVGLAAAARGPEDIVRERPRMMRFPTSLSCGHHILRNYLTKEPKKENGTTQRAENCGPRRLWNDNKTQVSTDMPSVHLPQPTISRLLQIPLTTTFSCLSSFCRKVCRCRSLP